MENSYPFLVGFIALGSLLFILGFKLGSQIETHKKINPEIFIHTHNGIADTTYVYRLR